LLHNALALLGDFTRFSRAIRTVFTQFAGFTANLHRDKFVGFVSTGFAGCHDLQHSSPFSTFECPWKMP
jgi:hypothetical protein